MKHLTHEELSAHLDRALSPGASTEAERHLAACEDCRNALASLAAQDSALRPALEHDPGDAYFESFAARVEDRIRAAGLRGAQAKAWEGGWLSWLRSPRRLATAGVLAAAVGGAAIVVVTARMERPQPALLEHPSATGSAPAPEAQSTLEATSPTNEVLRSEREAASGTQDVRSNASRADLDQSRAKESIALEQQASPAPTQSSPTRQVAPERAQAAPPRTDIGGSASGSRQGLATPPPAAPSTEGKRLADRKAEPAQDRARTLARDEATEETRAMATAPGERGDASSLCGRVVNAQGRPVMGAQVALADLGVTATTNEDGRFCFSAPAGAHEVTVLAMGYQESRLEARAGAATDLQVKLQPVPVLDSSPMAGNLSLYKSGTDAFAGSPASVRDAVAEARRLFVKAQRSGSASDYDAAAARWQRIVPGLTGAQVQEARFRLAEARFRAWEAGANATRMRAANDALIGFLRYASTGPQRDQAAGWLARMMR